MFFWYLGGSIAMVRYAFRDERMDLRVLALGALLPDLIDKPLAAVWYTSFHSIRLFGHTLLFAAMLMTGVLLATRRGRPRKRWMPLAVGVLVHLFLAFMWTEPETLWWPFLGTSFTSARAGTFWAAIVAELRSPLTWILEAAGLVYLVYLAVNGNLGEPEARRRFLRTGRIEVPIERT